MSETTRKHIPELTGTELVSEGPTKIDSALAQIDELNEGQQDFLQAGVVASGDWSMTLEISSSTGELASTGTTGGKAWLPDPVVSGALMRSVTNSAKLEKLKGSTPTSGKYVAMCLELTPSYWGGAGTVSVHTGTAAATLKEAEEKSPGTTSGKIKLREAIVLNTSGTYSIAAQKDRRSWATGGEAATETVAEGKIGASAVTTGKIKNEAVTEAKLASQAVTDGKVVNGRILLDTENKYSARSASLFSKEKIKEGETSTWTNPSPTRSAFLNIDFQIRSETARGEAVEAYVGGVLVTEIFANENNGSYHLASSLGLLVGPGEQVVLKAYAGGGSTAVESIKASYKLY